LIFLFEKNNDFMITAGTYPLDVVRRRMQIDPAHAPRYTGIMHALTTIYREEGLISGLYKGLSMNWIKGPISVGISFSVFDFVKSTIIQRHIEAEQK
jgi:solute carrier family 25 protein 42